MNKEYIASEYRRLHDANKFSGACLKQHLPEIKALIKEHDCKTALDYGCGKAVHHHKAKLGDVTLYDPYYAPHSKKPDGKFDMVICTDVLEHVSNDDAKFVLAELLAYTDKILFLAISTKPAIKKFSNGENVHLTIWEPERWNNLIDTLNYRKIKIVRHYS